MIIGPAFIDLIDDGLDFSLGGHVLTLSTYVLTLNTLWFAVKEGKMQQDISLKNNE